MVVVKFGGSILGEGVAPSILEDLRQLLEREKLILVHGGGEEVTEVARRMGKEQTFMVSPDGIRSRYTDRETASIYTMVMAGKIGKEVVLSLLEAGLPAIGLSGVDGRLLSAKRKKRLIVVDERGRRRIVDGGYTGRIMGVNTEILMLLLDHGYLPVVSPVAVGEEYELLNVDGDRAAAYIAGALQAPSILFMTDVEGVMVDGEVRARMSVEEAKGLMPTIGFGMKRKILAALEALDMGVERAIIAPGGYEHPLTSALKGRVGTLISRGEG